MHTKRPPRQVDSGTAALLQQLVQDREVHLYDGTRLLRHDRFDELMVADDDVF